MSSAFDTTDRFLRPSDLSRLRRNNRRLLTQRFILIARNGGLGLVALLAILWAYSQTQSRSRFAVRKIEVTGAMHTPAAEIARITQARIGTNLFRIDIGSLQHELRSLRWVARVRVEKKLPDTLRVSIAERQPVAIAHRGTQFEYVDETGTPFAGLSAAIGDPDLPVINDRGRDGIARSVALLRKLRESEPQVYSRISEVTPLAPSGVVLFDRVTRTVIYANEQDLVSQWRRFNGIATAEGMAPGSIEYADLRFADRVVIKPVHPLFTIPEVQPVIPAGITN